MHVILTFKLYQVQILHHTNRIDDHFEDSKTLGKCNNDPNWDFHLSLDQDYHEFKLLSPLYTSIYAPFSFNMQKPPCYI